MRDERTVLQRATLGKRGSEAAPQLQGRIARAFSNKSLLNTMEMMAVIQYILTAAQPLGSQGYYEKDSNDDTWACWCIILRNQQAWTKWIIVCFEENTYLNAYVTLGRSQGNSS